MKVIILAGGKGTRLGLEGIPKPMVPVDGVPLIERLVLSARNCGFRDFIFLNGYLGEVIADYFGDGQALGVNITHIKEPEPLGSAGAFNALKGILTEPFIVLYGDILMDIDLRHFADVALSNGGAGTLFVHPNDHPHDSDLLEVDENGRILAVHPKPHNEKERLANIVSAAIYVLYPRALDFVPSTGDSDWGRDIFKEIIKTDALYAYRSVEYAKDVGTPDRLARSEAHLRSGKVAGLSRRNTKMAVFIDRDGVINEEVDGVLHPGDLRLIPGAAQAIGRLNKAGVPAICVTNQPFLAKGQMTWANLRAVHAELDCLLAEEAGAYLDDVYVCPHHPEKGWPDEVEALKIECDCRKPKPGLLLKAAEFHVIDLRRSWFVGDRYSDVATAEACGAHGLLVQTGHDGKDRDRFPDIQAKAGFASLSEAIDYILKTPL